MKIRMLAFLLAACFVTAQAQDTTLQQFTGKYIFPDGSVVADVTVTLENGALTMTSTAGISPLVKTGEDLFAITEFEGTALFKRDTNKKVNAVTINARGHLLEGTKSDSIAIPAPSFSSYRVRQPYIYCRLR